MMLEEGDSLERRGRKPNEQKRHPVHTSIREDVYAALGQEIDDLQHGNLGKVLDEALWQWLAARRREHAA